MNEGHKPVAEISKGKVFATQALTWVANEAMQIMGKTIADDNQSGYQEYWREGKY